MTARSDIRNANAPVTPEDVRQLVGDVDDADIAAIIATGATPAELEQAWMRAQGYGDAEDRNGGPLTGAAAEVFELLSAYRQQDRDR
jgi:hypothetical protein